MAVQRVTLRKMTPAEYRAATEHREAESVRVLSRVMPEQLALERVRKGTVRFLPDGLDTVGHHLVTAENELGEAVGNAWIGPDGLSPQGRRALPGCMTSTSSLRTDVSDTAPPSSKPPRRSSLARKRPRWA